MHLFNGILKQTPLSNGVAEPEVLLAGECDADGLALDLAGPLIARPASAGSTILDIAFADPGAVSELFAQARIFLQLGRSGV